MPLAFDSISHGSIAFGFFNIDSDMLLLNHYFLFATEFCKYISDIAEREEVTFFETFWQVYSIEYSKDIGDLMGAIHGIHYQGFIGEVYRKFPFPRNLEDFKQKPEGVETRSTMDLMISKYASRVRIPFIGDIIGQTVKIGEYRLTRASFQALVKYVWRGGYPRWKGEIRPDYVLAMKTKIEQHQIGLLEKLCFED
jgi:hypothetical protein